MKKYVKPELFYERYELSEHIADCAWDYNGSTNEYTCIAEPDMEKIPFPFPLFSHAGCMIAPGDVEDLCYHTASPVANVFDS